MLTGVAVVPKLVSLGRWSFRSTPYDWVPLAVIMLLIVLIFVRVYVLGAWFQRRAAHRSGQRATHRANRVTERGGNRGHRAASKRRPNRR
jgi:hypothetical protein